MTIHERIAEFRNAAARITNDIVNEALEEIGDWEWAAPIPDTYLIKRGTLHCREHGDLLSAGVMELWEMALDARKHHQEHHAGDAE